MSQVSPQYIAGLFDGEGYVGIRRRNDTKNTSYRCQVEIANTNRNVLEEISAQHGGVIRLKKNKDAHCWYTLNFYTNKDSKEILELIKDHVIVKKDQVDLALACMEGTAPMHQGEWRLKAMKRVDHVRNVESLGLNYLDVVAEQWERKGKSTWIEELNTECQNQAA